MSTSQDRIDVTHLAREPLEDATFPVGTEADFRLHMTPSVRGGIEEHAKADTSVEICGVLVGKWGKDENGPFVSVTDYIRCDNADSKFAEVTFTHDSWAKINAEMDKKPDDSRIVGWYHSHPDFGIFLSDRDCFIQENFFSGPGQVAFVVDPIRDLEGMFAWRGGKPTPMSHFWIGDQIRTVSASERNPEAEAKQAAPAASYQPVTGQATGDSLLSMPLLLALGSVMLMTLGYFLGNMKSRWEQQKIVQGAVAHYGLTKVMKFGLKDDLAIVLAYINRAEKLRRAIPKDQSDIDEELRKEIEKADQEVSLLLGKAFVALASIQQHYGLDRLEQSAIEEILKKQDELNRVPPPKEKAKPKAKPNPSANEERSAKNSGEQSKPASESQEDTRLVPDDPPSAPQAPVKPKNNKPPEDTEKPSTEPTEN
ncbi:MAG: Mov34/MPN/PAD-1 family protein [Lacipirellulaceae bacterium]